MSLLVDRPGQSQLTVAMPLKPPPFGSQDYWNTRFTANPNPFEWLEAPAVLDPFLVEALDTTDDSDPQLLHIGCGTSLLSFHLRAHVKDPEQIHNLDYSEVAVKVGKQREVELFDVKPSLGEGNGEEAGHGVICSKMKSPDLESSTETRKEERPVSFQQYSVAPTTSYMRWSAANLLDYCSLLKACQPSTYSLIVDKSTSDSIACSDDLYVPLPYPITTSRNPSFSHITKSPEPIHPLHIVAIHLALVTKTKGRWISLSYSMDRYPFIHDPPPSSTPSEVPEGMATTEATGPVKEQGLDEELGLDDDLDGIPQKVMESGFPDPSLLWKLVGKYGIEAPPPAEPSNGHKGLATTHRSKIMHWIYVLERTDVQLFVRK